MATEKAQLKVEGEDIEIEICKGLISCSGYDIENEKLALKLAGGYGTGVGVFLVALEENYTNQRLKALVGGFEEDMASINRKSWNKRMGQSDILHGLKALITPLYLSYHPNETLRIESAALGEFSKEGWERLRREPNKQIEEICAWRGIYDQAVLIEWANHTDADLRASVAENELASTTMLAYLSHDPVLGVRLSVASNPNTDKETLLEVFQSGDDLIKEEIMERRQIPLEIYEIVMNSNDDDLKQWLAYKGRDSSLMEKFAHSQDPKLRVGVAGAQFLPKKLQEILLEDTDIEVVRALRDSYFIYPTLKSRVLKRLREMQKVNERGL